MLEKIAEKWRCFKRDLVLAPMRQRIKRYKVTRCEKQWSDWTIPLRYNGWVQLGVLFLLGGIGQIGHAIWYRCIPAYGSAFVFMFLLAGLSILGATQFGVGTVKSYRYVKHVLGRSKNTGGFDARLQVKLAKELYCYRAGARVAATELGLAAQLIPSLANWWKPL